MTLSASLSRSNSDRLLRPCHQWGRHLGTSERERGDRDRQPCAATRCPERGPDPASARAHHRAEEAPQLPFRTSVGIGNIGRGPADIQSRLETVLIAYRKLSQDRQYPVDPMRGLLGFRRMNFHRGHQLFVRHGAGDLRYICGSQTLAQQKYQPSISERRRRHFLRVV
jgi:hypothetical protein